MKVFTKKKLLIEFLSNQKKDRKIGFVPTMGALHEGHISLILTSKTKCDITICSIFVNPTQFNDKSDYKNYPIDIKSDLKKLNEIECDIVYTPKSSDLYSKNEIAKKYNFNGLEKKLEGEYRPGHFNGVATIVEKLFNIIQPNYAFFGEKDLQQLFIIKKLVEIKKIKTKIIGCPTIREKSGLAKSSRNQLLSKTDFKKSSNIYEQLLFTKKNYTTKSFKEIKDTVKHNLKNLNFEIDYFEFIDINTLEIHKRKLKGVQYATCIAVVVSKIRLIDNIIL